MSKITDYSYVETLASDNVFLIDGSNGTKIITAEDVSKSLSALLPDDDFYELLDRVGHRYLHRQIYRGKNLGSSFTAAQKAAIQSGTFEGLWLGDYWTFTSSVPGITSSKWRIVDFDYWYRIGESDDPSYPNYVRHHIVVMPDTRLYLAQMNETSTTEGGYYGSRMRGGENGIANSNLANALTAFQSFFGDALMSHPEYLSNAVTDGSVSGYIETESVIDLPSEVMMFGNNHRSTRSQAGADSGVLTYSRTQLAAMQAVPELIGNHTVTSLRDVVNGQRFAAITKKGTPGSHLAIDLVGVRPVAAIG